MEILSDWFYWSFFKAAIKHIKWYSENSKVIINADDTVYIAHDILDLIKEFKETRAKRRKY
jgi:hypothetical protein